MLVLKRLDEFDFGRRVEEKILKTVDQHPEILVTRLSEAKNSETCKRHHSLHINILPF